MLRNRFRRKSLQNAGVLAHDQSTEVGASTGSTHLSSAWRSVKTHDETVPFAGDDVNHELIFQSARVDRDERLDDAAVRVRNDQVRKALAGPLDWRESRDEEFAPSLCRGNANSQA